MTTTTLEKAYAIAQEQYAALGVDVEAARQQLTSVSLSLHCWQGDDVAGFETPEASLSGGGIMVTGNYPGRARTVEELRADLDVAYSLLPGTHRLNLHASYGEFGGKVVDRDAIEPAHFQGWVEWAKARGLGLDFNATCFSHPKAASGFTLSSPDPAIRAFWIEHVQRCRMITNYLGYALGDVATHNLWIPDGAKEVPVQPHRYRERLRESLDDILSTTYIEFMYRDAVESKLFGIGSEAFVVSSHEFYLGYALRKELMICLDMGHFHPTESVADKLSALLTFLPEVLIHVSRGVRWDSDHVVIQDDALQALMQAIVRGGALDRVHLATDYFDGSINRIGAWVIGARATLRALLWALLEPTERLREAEAAGDGFTRLALLEEAKALPFGAVWDYHCAQCGVPAGSEWIGVVKEYEARVLRSR